MSLQPIWLMENSAPDAFPDVELALTQPNGLLAVGGDLRPERLLCAYRRGIFPWFSDGQPILWWTPNPRTVLLPDEIRIRRSLRKVIRQERFEIRVNHAFEQVIRACSAPRKQQNDTWITSEMVDAYVSLHRAGFAHSIEAWTGDELVGGLYGVAIGRVFFGESMFSRAADASKVALVHLAGLDFDLIDCQLPSAHLYSMGARDLPRIDFTSALARLCPTPTTPSALGPSASPALSELTGESEDQA